MSDSKDAVLPDLASSRPANRREFLGKTAVAAAAAAGIPALLAACGESSTGPTQAAAAPASAGATGGLRPSLAGGRDFGATVSERREAAAGATRGMASS